ncbi:LysR substrate binding domain-containing protein [Hymenobacter psychrotolerans DSM 18569]|uniref:LysR substrate binding domain-containing protein n=1 Tax=Hymenobacter psychrotolerans DSM 18569 TaxID=1121959 RepID=A0A1M7HT31_9BACT|nr:LysR substrate binding domain-containing protein [Hymenobacter psychrotolerans DSM 18569]
MCSGRNSLHRRELQAQYLRQVPVALRETGSGTLAVLEEALAEKGIRLIDLPVKVRLGGTEALKNFVRVDTCLAFLPRQSVMKELAAGELMEVPIRDLNLVRHFDFVQRKGTENNLPYKEFVQFARRYYSKQE